MPLIRLIIILALLITTILNIGEISALISGTLKDQSELYTPIYIKATKDIIMCFLIFLLAVRYLSKNISISYIILVLFFLLIIYINIMSSILYGNDGFIIYGLRWIYPLLIFILGIKVFQINWLSKSFEKAFILVFLFHFSLQIYQFFSGITWFGLLGNYSSRNPGIFLLPNTGAFFSNIVLYWFMYHSQLTSFVKNFMVFLAVISIVLTSSGTGISVLAFLVILYLSSRKAVALLPIFILILPFMLKFVSTTRGDDYVEVSGGGRLGIFLETFGKTNIFAENFGYFTNVSVLVGGGNAIMDSTYASVLGNLGILGLMVVIGILFYLIFMSYLKLDKVKLSFLIIIASFSATTIIFEAYPMNLLLSLIACKIYGRGSYEYRPQCS